jgi:hypothetical protein
MRTWGLVVAFVVLGCMLAPSLASARTHCLTLPAQPSPLTSAELTQLQTCVTNMATTARSRAASIASAVGQCSADPDPTKAAQAIQRFSGAAAAIKQSQRLYTAYLQGEQRYYGGLGRQAVAGSVATLSQKLSQLTSTLYAMYLGRDAAASAIGSADCAKAQSKLAQLQQKAQTAKQQLASFKASLAKLQ